MSRLVLEVELLQLAGQLDVGDTLLLRRVAVDVVRGILSSLQRLELNQSGNDVTAAWLVGLVESQRNLLRLVLNVDDDDLEDVL